MNRIAYMVVPSFILFLTSTTTFPATNDIHELFSKLANSPNDKALLQNLKGEIAKTTNATDKAKLTTAYFLGCVYTGQNKEANAAKTFFLKEYTSDPNAKYFDISSLQSPCTKCNGKGSLETDCSTCGGSGQCNTCNGGGTRNVARLGGSSETIRCTACNGSGKCKACRGVGRTKTSCGQCGGSGLTLSSDKIKVAYLAVLTETTATVPTKTTPQDMVAKSGGETARTQTKNESQIADESNTSVRQSAHAPSGKMDAFLAEKLTHLRKEHDQALQEQVEPVGYISAVDETITDITTHMSDDFGGTDTVKVDTTVDYWKWTQTKEKVRDRVGWTEYVKECGVLLNDLEKFKKDRELAEQQQKAKEREEQIKKMAESEKERDEAILKQRKAFAASKSSQADNTLLGGLGQPTCDQVFQGAIMCDLGGGDVAEGKEFWHKELDSPQKRQEYYPDFYVVNSYKKKWMDELYFCYECRLVRRYGQTEQVFTYMFSMVKKGNKWYYSTVH